MMHPFRFAGTVAVALLLSGCANITGRSDLARLQSQVNLLDQRLSQLERSSVTELSASSAEMAPIEEPRAVSVHATAPKTAAQISQSQAVSSLKPSTREIQQALKNAGFYQGNIDGKMGPVTRSAIKEFQRVHGLRDDGVVGKQTWLKLREYASLSAESLAANSAEKLK